MEAWKARLFSALEDRLSAEGHGALTEECAKQTSVTTEYGASGCWLDSNKVVEYDGPVCKIVDHPVEEPFWSRTSAALPDPVPTGWIGGGPTYHEVAFLRGLHYKYVPPAMIQRERVDRGYVLGLLNKGVPALQYGDHIDPAHILRTMYVLSFACPEESDEPFLCADLALSLLSAGHVSLSDRGLFGPPRSPLPLPPQPPYWWLYLPPHALHPVVLDELTHVERDLILTATNTVGSASIPLDTYWSELIWCNRN